MTKTTEARKVRRETPALWRGRNLVIELAQYEISIRPKGTRTGYRVSYDQVFKLGAENEARRRREERAAKRQTRRRK